MVHEDPCVCSLTKYCLLVIFFFVFFLKPTKVHFIDKAKKQVQVVPD